MEPADLVAALRAGWRDELLALVAFRPALGDDKPWEVWDDPTGEFREKVIEVLLATHQPDDYPLVRYLLIQEQANCHHNESMTDELRACAFLLASYGRVTDALLLYKAKTLTSWDAACGMDWEVVFGAGIAPTLAWVRALGEAGLERELPEADPTRVLETLQEQAEFVQPFERYALAMKAYFAGS
jgi:hypothetical protein